MNLSGFICEFFRLVGSTVIWTVPYDCTVFTIISTDAVAFGPFGQNYPTITTNGCYFVAPVAGAYDVAIDFQATQVVYLSQKAPGNLDVVVLHSPPESVIGKS